MPAGTIALNNNSTAVTGSGTNFSSELKANDFIVAVVGGVTYTLGVKSVESATALTLITSYGGATASGLSWTPVPNATLVGITAQVAADVAKAIRGLNLDKANWQQIFTSTGNVTVNLPDGSSWSGPSWGYMADQYSSKANASDVLTRADNLASLVDKGAARTNLGLAYGTAVGTAAQGNDARLNTVHNKSGGTLTSGLSVNGALSTSGTLSLTNATADSSGNAFTTISLAAADARYNIAVQYWLLANQYHAFRTVQNGVATFEARASGACYAASFNPTSDSRLKFNKSFIKDALVNAMTLRGMSYNLQGERKAGVIAQDAESFMPEAVTTGGSPIVLEDGTVIADPKSLDYSAVAAVHTEALKGLAELMLRCMEDPDTGVAELRRVVAAINCSEADKNATDMRMEWALVEQPAAPVEQYMEADDTGDNESNKDEKAGS